MNTTELDTRINNFLQRKYITYPDLAASKRRESRTVKYAMKLRATSYRLMAH